MNARRYIRSPHTARVVLCAALLMSGVLPISTSQAGDNLFIGLAGFHENGGDHAGVEAYVANFGHGHTGFKFSGVLYTGTTANGIEDTFGGYSATTFLHMRTAVNPYVGVGFFLGETFNCTDEEEKAKTCTEEVIFAAYPEIGVAFNFTRFHASLFARRYTDTFSHTSSVNAAGLSIGTRFDY